jgi:hypothetical protein
MSPSTAIELTGLAMVLVGIYVLAGFGWTLIAAAIVCLALGALIDQGEE